MKSLFVLYVVIVFIQGVMFSSCEDDIMDAVMDEKEAKKFVHVHPKPAAERQRTLPEECCVEGCTNEEVRETGLGWTAVQYVKQKC